MLHLLQRTGLEVWRRTRIDQTRLEAWPEEGNLVHVDGVTRVEEPESATMTEAATTTDGDAMMTDADATRDVAPDEVDNGELYHDDGDLGPAPLQAALAPEETIEGTEMMSSNADAQQVCSC